MSSIAVLGISIPNPISWADGWLHSIDPFTQLAGRIAGGYNWMVGLYENLLVQMPGSQQQSWVIHLLNNALGVAIALSLVSSVLISALAIFKHKKLQNAISATVMTIFMMVNGASIFVLCYGAMALSRHLSKAAEIYHPSSHANGNYLLSFTAITSILGSVFGYGLLLVMGFTLFCLLLSYVVADVLFMAFGVIALGLRFWGTVTEKLSDLFISLGLVTMVLGTPAAILCLNIGRLLGDALASSPLGQYSGAGALMGWVGMAAGFWWAFAWQIILVIGTSIAVSKVTGRVNAVSQVFGRVDTKPDRHEVDANTFNQEHAASQKPMTVPNGKGHLGNVVRYAKEETKHQAIAAGAKVALGAATGGSGLVAGVVATAATRTVQQHTPRIPETKGPRTPPPPPSPAPPRPHTTP